MSKGPKQASKTTSSNRILVSLVLVPIYLGIIALVPSTSPASSGPFGHYMGKFSFLMTYAPVVGILLGLSFFMGLDAGAKLVGGGVKIGDATELSDFEGK